LEKCISHKLILGYYPQPPQGKIIADFGKFGQTAKNGSEK
jgi:hypothetical protein